jgi:dTDP-4-dehydrorhamnose reductase
MIVIFGKGGQLGSSLEELLKEQAVCLSVEEADFIRPETLYGVLNKYNPTAVINAAAYTAVDKAEEEQEIARLVNAESPEIIAKYCLEKNIPFIHYSTDYVFPGDKQGLWVEEDIPAPLNVYGETKLLGEEKIKAVGGKYIIFRTSWVYDENGKNFVNTMLRLGAEREALRVVSDQIGAPTYARDLAEATIKLLNQDFEPGIYHLCNAGETNWHEFAETIFAFAREHNCQLEIKIVEAIKTSEYPTPAKRPLNSRLNCSKAKESLNITLPDWKDSLRNCLAKKFG